MGYRVFARWVASDQAFSIVRRFGALNTRVILGLQNKLARLERKLGIMGEEYSRKEMPNDTNNGLYIHEPLTARTS